jgi:dTDP-4-dehydrorhamnose reductase
LRIAVIGARGQLAAAVIDECQADHELIPFPHADLDVTDAGAVAAAMDAARPDVIVNGAAFTDVDGAEDHPIDALNINAFGVRALARAAAKLGAGLVHYSTDFVFDGHATRPYTESDAPNPQSVYGQSKLMGEWLASDAPRAYVLRVESLFGGPAARSSIDRIITSLRSGEPARVFVDRVVTPSFVDDVVDATWSLLTREAEPGLYHVVNAGETTWHALGAEAARLLGTDANLVPVRVADVPMRAARPQYCALSTARLAGAGVSMPAWQDALGRYIRLLAN